MEPGPPLGLGMAEFAAPPPATVPLEPSCVLLAYTDGVSEARDAAGEFYPLPERVRPQDDPVGLVRSVWRDVSAYTGEIDDDVALLALRVAPAAERARYPRGGEPPGAGTAVRRRQRSRGRRRASRMKGLGETTHALRRNAPHDHRPRHHAHGGPLDPRPRDPGRRRALMREHNVGALPIADGDERLCGIVTDRDIVVKCVAAGQDPSRVTCGDVAEGTPAGSTRART